MDPIYYPQGVPTSASKAGTASYSNPRSSYTQTSKAAPLDAEHRRVSSKAPEVDAAFSPPSGMAEFSGPAFSIAENPRDYQRATMAGLGPANTIPTQAMPRQRTYGTAVYPQRPAEMSTAAEIPDLTSAFQRLYFPPAAGDRGRDMAGDRHIPTQRQTVAHAYKRPAAQPAPQLTETPATHPSAKPTKLLRTDKATYEVLKDIDPRTDKSTSRDMSHGINLIQNKQTGLLFVEKRLKVTSEVKRVRTFPEVAALKQIRDAGNSYNINFIQECYWDGSTECASLILEYCDHGSVDNIVEEYRNKKSLICEDFAWHVLAGLTKALCFIHEGLDVSTPGKPRIDKWNTICHLDIKPANVFLSTRGETAGWPRVVLGDLGCVVTWKDIKAGKADRQIQLNGTPGWMPPELHIDTVNGGVVGKYGIPTDIYQMGGVVQAVCRLSVVPNQELVDEGRPCGSRYSGDLNDMICHCMAREYLKRPRSVDMVGEVQKRMERGGFTF